MFIFVIDVTKEHSVFRKASVSDAWCSAGVRVNSECVSVSPGEGGEGGGFGRANRNVNNVSNCVKPFRSHFTHMAWTLENGCSQVFIALWGITK